MTAPDSDQKILDFLHLMHLIYENEQKDEKKEDAEENPLREKCAICQSRICAMIQDNQDLQCWTVYEQKL